MKHNLLGGGKYIHLMCFLFFFGSFRLLVSLLSYIFECIYYGRCVLCSVTLLDTTLKESLEWVTYTRQHDDPQKRGVSALKRLFSRHDEKCFCFTLLVSKCKSDPLSYSLICCTKHER